MMYTFLNIPSGKRQARAILSLVFLLLATTAFATDYYVALPPLGNDATNNGRSVDSPYATIGKAAGVAGPGDVVYVMAGTYREEVAIQSDGVTFRPYGDDVVTINGTDLMLNWTLLSGSTYQTTMNWDVDTTWGSNQLFQDGQMIELARWPKQTSNDLVMPTNAKADDVTATKTTITIIDADFNEPAARWVGAQIWINLARAGYDGQGWTGTVHSIEGNAITVNLANGRLGNRAWGLGVDTEYFLFSPLPANVEATGGVDALLGLGEWWKNGTDLYVKTRNGAVPSSTGTGSSVIEAKRRHFAFIPGTINRSGYTIQGFHLFASTITTDKSAIITNADRTTTTNRRIVEEAHDIILDGLNVKYPSHQTNMRGNWQDQHYVWSGIVVSGRNNTIRNCSIRYSATSALSIQGFGIKVLNNEIEETNYMCSNAGAINTGFFCQDADIGYNKIWNTTVMAINFRYSKNSNPDVRNVYRIHHNEIYNFMRRSGDSGAIDMVGQDLQWIRIDHNLIYNTLDDAKLGFMKHGIYLDYGDVQRDYKIRANVDHNVIYEVNNPILINPGSNVNVFNNVLLSHLIETDEYSQRYLKGLTINFKLINYKSNFINTGKNIRVYNNIMNTAVSLTDPDLFDIRHNITNATGAVLSELFVDAAHHDYRLKPTATQAIDKGIPVAEYMGDNYDEPIEGITDLGAYEWGTFLTGPDTQAPLVPAKANFVVSDLTGNSFRISWNASIDNVGVAYYEVYSNGTLIKKTSDTTLALTRLEGSTTYSIEVLAVDGSGNRSALSEALEVKTLAPVFDVNIDKTTTAPVIDGTKEATWSSPMLPIAKRVEADNYAGPDDVADLSGEWTSLWDDSNLYLFIDVNDNVNKVDSPTGEWYYDDHIEILIDADGSRPRTYGNKQHQYYMVRGGTFYKYVWPAGVDVSGSESRMVEKADRSGYQLEVKIPFIALGVTPEALAVMGIDVQIGDDDDGGGEDTRLSWITTDPNASNNPTLFGAAKLIAPGIPNDTENPSTPTGLTPSNILPTEFTVTWNASTDNDRIHSYELYVNGNLVGTTKLTSYNLMDLTEGTTYSVQVRAKDRFINRSGLSSVVKVTTPTRASGVKYEAEKAVLAGATSVSSLVSGYSGSGYVQQAATVGASVTFTVTVPSAGTYPVLLQYTGNGSLSYYVNGTRIDNTKLLSTASDNDWSAATELLTLKAGINTIMYRYQSGNKGAANLDYILIYPSPGADSKAPSVPTNVTVSNITTSSFTLNWTASTDNSEIAPSYEVYQDDILIGSTTSTTYSVTSLLPGTYAMTVKAVDAMGIQSDASDVQPVTTLLSGVVIREYWANVAGTAVSNIPVNTKPTSVSVITSLEDPTPSSVEDQYNDFGQRIRGYIVPSTTATYYFYIASDNNGEFWLSSDDQPANKGTAPIASLNGNSGPREWTKDLRNQKSAGMALVAGRKYYFEALMKESGGNNNLAIGWTTATDNTDITVVGSSNIEAYVTPVSVTWTTVSPATAGIEKGETKQLKVSIFPTNATNQAISWSSSNPAVATVDSTGLVTGVGFGIVTITATVQDGNKTLTSVIAVDPTAVRGEVIQEIWNNISGATIASIPVNTRPTKTQVLTSLEDMTPNGAGGDLDNFGQRIRGYIIPSTTATYHFYMAADNVGEFWLSSDYNPANKGTAPIASVNNPTSFWEWNNSQNATQKSAGIALIAGRKYYFEALMKETSGGNNLAIGWTTATDNTSITVISSNNLGKYEEECSTCRTSVEAERKSLTLEVYPNPASSEVTLDLSGFEEESAVQVKITDRTGKLFASQQAQLREGVKKVTLPVSHLPQGLFFVTVQGSKTTKSAKLVITK